MKFAEIMFHVFATGVCAVVILILLNLIVFGTSTMFDYINVFLLSGSIRMILILIFGDYKDDK